MSIVPWERGLDKSRPMNHKVMWDNMIVFKESMDKHNIPFVIIFGGLLGLIREGKLIDWDDDIDLFCFSEDHRRIEPVVKELESKGFYIPNKNECPMHDHFFIREGEKIEIWWFDSLDGERVYDQVVRYPKEYLEKTETYNHKGVDWLIPSKPKEFLELTYGPKWKIPNPNGNYGAGLGKLQRM